MKKVVWIVSLVALTGLSSFLSKMKNDFGIDEAKKHFGQVHGNKTVIGELQDKVIWEDAATFAFAPGETIVLAPLLTFNLLKYKLDDHRKGRERTDDFSNLGGGMHRELVFRKVSGKVECLEMRIIPHDNYVSRRKGSQMDIENFYGFIYFFEMSGKLRLCLVYEYGKIVAMLKDKTNETLGSSTGRICMNWIISKFFEEVKPKNGNDRTCGTVIYAANENIDKFYPAAFTYAVNRNHSTALKVMRKYMEDSIYDGKSMGNYKN